MSTTDESSPTEPLSPQLRETHSGLVLLMGSRAYKIKKAVDLGFLNFTTEQARGLACKRELELNRRLAPDVYLDVATVTSSDGSPCEHVLVMRRMPDELRLSSLLNRGVDVDDQLRAIARLMAQFHAVSQRTPAIDASITADHLHQRWMGNLHAAEPFRGSTLADTYDAIQRYSLSYLEGRQVLLDERSQHGFAVDGHGDLLADDIFCLPDYPRILDCLDFDDALRWVDIHDDIAFLAMDLERLGNPRAAVKLLDWYAEFSGRAAPTSLLHHYIAYRAFVRATVSCIRASQGAEDFRRIAQECSQLALAHLKQSEVRIVLVGGSPGTGKSTLAAALAHELGYVLLSSDSTRKQQFFASSDTYSPEAKRATYRALLDDAREALIRGESVIADATWGEAQMREAATELARDTTSRLIALECHVPSAMAAERAQRRYETGGTLSDADGPVAFALAASRSGWPDATPIDTSLSTAESLSAALAAVTL